MLRVAVNWSLTAFTLNGLSPPEGDVRAGHTLQDAPNRPQYGFWVIRNDRPLRADLG